MGRMGRHREGIGIGWDGEAVKVSRGGVWLRREPSDRHATRRLSWFFHCYISW